MSEIIQIVLTNPRLLVPVLTVILVLGGATIAFSKFEWEDFGKTGRFTGWYWSQGTEPKETDG